MTSNGRGSAKKSVRGSSVSGPVAASKVIRAIFHCILPKGPAVRLDHWPTLYRFECPNALDFGHNFSEMPVSRGGLKPRPCCPCAATSGLHAARKWSRPRAVQRARRHGKWQLAHDQIGYFPGFFPAGCQYGHMAARPSLRSVMRRSFLSSKYITYNCRIPLRFEP